MPFSFAVRYSGKRDASSIKKNNRAFIASMWINPHSTPSKSPIYLQPFSPTKRGISPSSNLSSPHRGLFTPGNVLVMLRISNTLFSITSALVSTLRLQSHQFDSYSLFILLKIRILTEHSHRVFIRLWDVHHSTTTNKSFAVGLYIKKHLK